MIPEIGQGVMVRPFQKPHPPIVVTVVEPSRGAPLRRPRAVGTSSPPTSCSRSGCGRTGRRIRPAGRRGHPPDPANWRVAKTVLVADDERTAREYGFGQRSPYRHYYDQLGFKLIRAGRANLFKADPALPDSAVTTDTMVEQLVIAGTASQVVEEILAFRDEIGDFGTLLYCGLDWVDPVIARRSMELMAEEVMPEVNRAIHGGRMPNLWSDEHPPERPSE